MLRPSPWQSVDAGEGFHRHDLSPIVRDQQSLSVVFLDAPGVVLSSYSFLEQDFRGAADGDIGQSAGRATP